MNLRSGIIVFIFCFLIPSVGISKIKQFDILDISALNYSELSPYFSTNISGLKNKPYAIEAELYPLGFSKDSSFAYLVIPPDEARDFLIVEVHVQNLINNKTVFYKQYDFDKINKLPKDYPFDFDSFIKKYQKDIDAILKKHQIPEQELSFETKIKPLLLSKEKHFSTTNDMGPFLDKLTVTMTNKKHQRKTIFNKKLAKYTYDSAIAGYFKSPFEDRIALILLSMQRGWEGPPHISYFTLIGASLSKGFQ